MPNEYFKMNGLKYAKVKQETACAPPVLSKKSSVKPKIKLINKKYFFEILIGKNNIKSKYINGFIKLKRFNLLKISTCNKTNKINLNNNIKKSLPIILVSQFY